ncbi:uncharacterized protein LOC126776187 [Nymphalis io]|uniref:uncharacterized protein LOC126776187 n=1 Tax=Inachis io TaxID=171585 RepID=UPI0021680D9F|nr:uncharacterized protein LOC126776187 [Nymphalis io]
MFYIYLTLLFGVLAQESFVTSTSVLDDVPNGNCSCGGFDTFTPDQDSEPLLSQTPMSVKCNEEGASTCKSLCLALATATKAKGPEILCARLKDVNEIKLSAFYKICERPWYYAEMTAEEPLCCENSKVKVCSSVEDITVAANAEAKL